jgi:glycosyltransferase involved in cell wall biosynthesis
MDLGLPVHRVLFIVPSLEFGGTSKQLQLLALGLPRARFHVHVAVLATRGLPQAEYLRSRGIQVSELGGKRLVDFGPVRRLHQLLKGFRPDVIHAWHLMSLRVLVAAGTRSRGLLVVSRATQPGQIQSFWQRSLDGWLLARADWVVAAGASEVRHYRRQKTPEGKIIQIPPGVAAPSAVGSREQLCQFLGISQDARLVFCAGPLVSEKGFQDAIWTVDILKHLFESLHLVLIGGGPDRGRLEQFVRAVGAEGFVHFLGNQPDAAALFGLGEMIWVPSRRHGGVNVTLEAMAAGRPVVASRLPALAEIVADGRTGFLIDPGDKVALARKTRLLLDDPKRGFQMGEAARQRAEHHFAATQFADRFARFYEASIAVGKLTTEQDRKGLWKAGGASA